MRKKENRESIQKGKDGKESRKTYKKSMLAAGFLAVGMFMGSTEVLAMPQEGEERVAYAKVNTCLNIRTGAGTEYGVSQGRLLQGTGRCGRLVPYYIRRN